MNEQVIQDFLDTLPFVDNMYSKIEKYIDDNELSDLKYKYEGSRQAIFNSLEYVIVKFLNDKKMIFRTSNYGITIQNVYIYDGFSIVVQREEFKPTIWRIDIYKNDKKKSFLFDFDAKQNFNDCTKQVENFLTEVIN